ncbi:MSMEG_0567/Sll0786 family nitrogen starvation N-acetyltransferase [Chamaesiphon sp. GL140_3_metabinner_50]|uniref:MSMEG_0567/Sll0786 family nitrogen starvation N-acetyltransferase n=1 Tax=Chamaesiphon sp. GL140_3_metabinner_50 TaxID=2970812 RepID=UPI0025F87220|nr:MSMEG_0567/Sll0786 family nitrogen starvation N-acetyltransferase [Chamaesiphon sp. GL140_3_metabinner_50]
MSYLFKLARTHSEITAYYALRRKIFVEEQALFPHDDVDTLDAIAYPIIAVTHDASAVLGVVRIYEPESRLWYGGRLGTHPDYRRGWHIGKGLIDKAVTTANAWGCDRFLATVQIQNVRFFQRLHWNSLEEIEIRGIAHHLMQADLDYYPANNEIRPVLQLSQAS